MKTLVISSACAGAILLLPTKGEAALGDQVLRSGMKNPDVKQLQKALASKGLLKSSYITGYYGPLTTNAVKEFQKRNHLAVDGITGKMTVRAITKGTVKPPVSNPSQTPSKSSYKSLSQGSQGAEVERLQRKLKELKHFKYPKITGYYGRVTADAVKSYQKSKNFAATGVADNKTQFSLFRASSTKPGTKPAETGLRLNSRGAQVSQLQSDLHILGLYNYKIDGAFGRITENGVIAFQKKSRLSVTGVADRRTLDRLEAEVNKIKNQPQKPPKPQKPDPIKEPSEKALRLNSVGPEVYQLQSDLKRLGFYIYKVDRIFGKLTEASVKSFQRKYSLSATGIADQTTLNKITLEVKKVGGTPTPKPDQPNKPFSTIDLIADAAELVGVPYTWGGDTIQEGFDCSGFLVYLFKKQNVQLPRTVATIWNAGTPVSQPKVGDIVFFETYKKGPSHAGIYIGNNNFVHSGTNGVTISDIRLSYWTDRYLGAKQLY